MINKNNLGGLISLALIGAVVCTLCDMNHVYTRTLSYPDPLWLGQAGWVFPLFLLTFLVMAVVYAQLVARLAGVLACRQSQEKQAVSAFFAESMVLFFLAYLLTGFANKDSALLALTLYGVFLIRVFASYERGFLLVLAVLMAIGGMLGEGALGALGLVQYRIQEVVGVPWWLGALYMNGAFALREGMRFFLGR